MNGYTNERHIQYRDYFYKSTVSKPISTYRTVSYDDKIRNEQELC